MARHKNKKKKPHGHAPPAGQVAVSRDLVERELNDPERLTLHLRRLSELLTVVPALRTIRFQQDALVDALIGLDRGPIDAAPAEKRGQVLRTAIMPGLVTE